MSGLGNPCRFEVFLVSLDPAKGSEIKKTRPCLIISPDEMNQSKLKTVIAAPMTTAIKAYPSRIALQFQGKKGEVALDQIRAIDKTRLKKYLGQISNASAQKVIERLQELFAK